MPLRGIEANNLGSASKMPPCRASHNGIRLPGQSGTFHVGNAKLRAACLRIQLVMRGAPQSAAQSMWRLLSIEVYLLIAASAFTMRSRS
jgi:hypothetical protein